MCFVTSVESGYDDPQHFDQAWNHPDEEEKIKWRVAIKKEFGDMKKNNVWEPYSVQNLPPNRVTLGTKWVFKKKSSGVYRARLVALGYSQIPGVDYSANFSPVINETTMRIVLLMMLKNNWTMELIDIETAFLYGDLEEEIFLKIPSGYNQVVESTTSTDCLKLRKSLYGLVQASRQWWKHFVKTLKNLNFKRSKIDPCLLMRQDESGILILCIYVDDVLCIGTSASIEKGIKDILNYFTIKHTKEVKEYVGCSIVRDIKTKKIYFCQPGLINRLEMEFKNEVDDLKKVETPATPGQIIIRPQPEDELLSNDQQKKYRSGVGMLLYLVKYSRPDIANSVRELSKVMDGAAVHHYKNLLRVIKFVISTKNKCLVMHGNTTCGKFSWNIQAFSDSDYAGDKDTRLSVSGFVIYICGNAVAWRSKAQRNVTLSSSEAEYVAVSEVCAEVMFVKQVIEFLNIKLELPIKILMDNVGAMFLTENQSMSQRTRHIDVRYHFIRDYVEDGVVQVIFVRSEHNDADVFTKNLGSEAFHRHASKFIDTTN
jgi:hypothetical protein